MGNNPEVLYTGYPFGSLTELTRDIDFENNTVGAIGRLEHRILMALLQEGIGNARRELQNLEDMQALTLVGEEDDQQQELPHEGQLGLPVEAAPRVNEQQELHLFQPAAQRGAQVVGQLEDVFYTGPA